MIAAPTVGHPRPLLGAGLLEWVWMPSDVACLGKHSRAGVRGHGEAAVDVVM
jgi:hypothetical protein